jgi:UrcA family protein
MFHPVKIAIAACIALAGTCAMAEQVQLVKKVTVDYSDLDLSNQNDAHELLARLEKAAFDACGGDERRNPAYKTTPRRTTEVFRECRENAVSRAVTAVNSQELRVALSEARGGDSATAVGGVRS